MTKSNEKDQDATAKSALVQLERARQVFHLLSTVLSDHAEQIKASGSIEHAISMELISRQAAQMRWASEQLINDIQDERNLPAWSNFDRIFIPSRIEGLYEIGHG